MARPALDRLVIVVAAVQLLFPAADRPATVAQPTTGALRRDDSTDAYKNETEVPALTGDNAKRADELDRAIDELRTQAKYAEAIPLAEQVLAMRRHAQGEQWWETRDARRLVATLEQIASLSPEAQAELAEADRSDGPVRDMWFGRQFDALLDAAQRQRACRERLLGQTHPMVGRCASYIGIAYENKGDFARAERHFREALDIHRTHLGTIHPDTAINLVNLGRLLSKRGHYEAAEASIREGLEIYRKLLGDEHADVATIQNILGYLLYLRGDYLKAESLLRETLALRRKLLGDRSVGVATTLNNLAAVLSAKADDAGAEALRREVLDIHRDISGPEDPRLATGLHNLSGTLRDRGNYAEAEWAVREALAIRRRVLGDSHPYTGSSLGQLGHVLRERGDYGAAERCMRSWLDSARLTLGDDHPYVSSALKGLADVLLEEGDYAEAETLLRRALTLDRRNLGDEHPGVATTMNDLGKLLLARGDRAGATALHRQALQMRRELLGNDHPAVAVSMHDLANSLEGGDGAEDLAEAERMHAEALSIRRRTRSQDLHTSCTAYADLLWRHRDRALDAIALYREAVEHIEARRHRVAGDALDRARYFTRLSRGGAFDRMVRVQIAPWAKTSEPTQDRSGTGPAVAFNYLERGRGRAVLDLMDAGGHDLLALIRAQATDDGDHALRRKTEEIQQRESEARASRRSAEAMIRTTSKDNSLTDAQQTEHIRELTRQRDEACDADRQAARDLWDLARDVLGSKGLRPLTAEEVAAALEPGEILLAYDVGTSDSVLLIVGLREREGIPRSSRETEGRSVRSNRAGVRAYTLKWPDKTDVSAEALTATIDRVFDRLSRETDKSDPMTSKVAGHAPTELLSTLLPTELHKEIGAARRVFVVPDGPLHWLPFETLIVDSAKGERWLDVGPAVVCGPSGAVLLHRRRQGTKRPRGRPAAERPILVALGDPAFGSGRPEESLPPSEPASNSTDTALTLAMRDSTRDAFGKLDRLPGTRAEIEAIAQLVLAQSPGHPEAVRSFAGHEATVTNLFNAVKGPRFLHLATHGLVERGRKVYDSALAMAAPKTVTPQDDGFLRLGDLLSRWGGKLDGTELVVLSACRTARGRMESGEGFVALTWGFLFAGAENVVATLWKVDDTATALLMTRFYANLLGSGEEGNGQRSYQPPMSKADALFEAKRWLRNLDADQAAELGKDLSRATKMRGAGPISEVVPARGSDRPYADPFYWGAFVLVGDGS